MRNLLFTLALVFCLSTVAIAESADYTFIPPTGKAALKAAQFPLSESEAKALLALSYPTKILTTFVGQNKALKEKAESPIWQVASNIPVNQLASDLFAPVAGSTGRYIGALASQDALALRLHVDLDGFTTGQRLYLLDPNGERTFGPYTQADARSQGCWLPTTLGAKVVMLLESDDNTLPALYITELSHFYQPPVTKDDSSLPCPIPVQCETDTTALEVATSEAMIIVPLYGGQAQCSGTLLNRMGTPDYTPLFVTAHHCFEGGDVNAEDVDVYWDYRSGSCDSTVAPPELNTLPRSQGDELLAESSDLDAQFLRLADAPVGAYGRAWAGWDTREIVVGDLVQGFHYPKGTHMKTCRGTIIEANVTECLDLMCATRYELQNTVRWDEGITEAGSSGSGLFLRTDNYRLCGMLSNGTTHICGRPENNRDNYSSFGDFFPAIACYFADDLKCEDTTSGCFFNNIFGKDNDLTKQLRAFRDDYLSKSAFGQALSRTYYKMSGKITPSLR